MVLNYFFLSRPFTIMLFMAIPQGQKLGPLNGPNCIPMDPPVETAWGTFDGAYHGALWLSHPESVALLLEREHVGGQEQKVIVRAQHLLVTAEAVSSVVQNIYRWRIASVAC